MKNVTSRQNTVVAKYRAVARGDERTWLLLDGPHLVAEALAGDLTFHHALVAAEDIDRVDIRRLVDQLERQQVEIATAAPTVMAAASPVRSSSAIVALVDRPGGNDASLFAGNAALVVIACDVQDPGNVGAIARVSEAGGATGMMAAGQSADPFGWKALRGSMGSALRLPIAIQPRTEEAVALARRHGCRVVATVARDGRSLFDADLRGPLAILVGGEGSGLPPSLVHGADVTVTIPMQAPVESLNTAMTAALLVYEARRQRR